jgi:hypothetical protein
VGPGAQRPGAQGRRQGAPPEQIVIKSLAILPTVTLQGLMVTGGNTANIQSGDTSGAGIGNDGTMELVDVVFTQNRGPANRASGAISSRRPRAACACRTRR